jgi:hypothetical protein
VHFNILEWPRLCEHLFELCLPNAQSACREGGGLLVLKLAAAFNQFSGVAAREFSVLIAGDRETSSRNDDQEYSRSARYHSTPPH